MRLSRDNWIKSFLGLALAMPIVAHSMPYFQRPPRQPAQQALALGIDYQRVIWTTPRPVVLHVATIDLDRLGVLVSPNVPTPDQRQITAMTTTEFLQKHKVQLAVNASFFYPFRENSPWDYYPKSGDRNSVVGQAIANGHIYSEPTPKWSMICFDHQNRAQILSQNTCPQGTQQAVSGNETILLNGQPPQSTIASDSDKPYPRLILAHDKTGKKLWAIAVDGKQPAYSEGAMIHELVPFLQQLGADAAINLDGGGSTTMVMATTQGSKVLNAPIQNKIPMNERPVANHIGFFGR
jgi:exopolysaccharide biosynthesis protein